MQSTINMSFTGDKYDGVEEEERPGTLTSTLASSTIGTAKERRETLSSTLASSTHNGEIETGSEESPQFSKNKNSLEFNPATEYKLRGLAKTLSRMSRTSGANVPNPFTAMDIPALDPNSPSFDAERWAKTYFNIMEDDPERYPQRTAGVSYRNLNVFGFGSDTDYQKTVFNVLLHSVNFIGEIFRGQPRVPILTNFDGLIKSGEMCVVLGRPGR